MKLFFYPVCPISNKLRILFKKINITCEYIKIISKQDVKAIPNVYFQYLPLLEYKDEFFRDISSIMLLLSNISNDKIITDWKNNEEIQFFEIFFDKYMFFDIYKKAVFEKTQKLILSNEYFPDNAIIQDGISKMEMYLQKIECFFAKNNWFHGAFSVNDISCFAMIASLDYCFIMPWFKFPNLKKWYRRLKSMEDFNFILSDKIYNFVPPKHYENIDF